MKKQEFSDGIKDGIPICLGYFSVSMAFGLTAALSGFPIWSAVLISLTNVTSAGQFAGINIIAAAGSLFELAVTTLIINMRYFLMSLSVSQKISQDSSLLSRMAISFGITDEIFAVSMQRKKALTPSYMAGLIITPVMGWTMGTLTGAAATSFMPPSLSNAMGIALYGMFIAIIVPPARDNKKILAAVVMAVAASCMFSFLPLLKEISSGWAVIIITVAVSAVAAVFMPVEEAESE